MSDPIPTQTKQEKLKTALHRFEFVIDGWSALLIAVLVIGLSIADNVIDLLFQ